MKYKSSPAKQTARKTEKVGIKNKKFKAVKRDLKPKVFSGPKDVPTVPYTQAQIDTMSQKTYDKLPIFFKTLDSVPKSPNKKIKSCWSGYEAIGMKTKNGRKVPNCVPKK